MADRLYLDSNGFLYADGVKIGRLFPERGTIQFCDKSPCRSAVRGSRYVEVLITSFIYFLSGGVDPTDKSP